MNVSAVALAAVDIAASVVEAALLNVQRTVAKSMQQPEVCANNWHNQLVAGLHTIYISRLLKAVLSHTQG